MVTTETPPRPFYDDGQTTLFHGDCRPGDHDDAFVLCRQIRAWRIPLFFKQWGGRTPTAGGHLIDLGKCCRVEEGLREYHEFPADAGDRAQGAAAPTVALDPPTRRAARTRTVGP